jgi:hypothetical protein
MFRRIVLVLDKVLLVLRLDTYKTIGNENIPLCFGVATPNIGDFGATSGLTSCQMHQTKQ